MTRPSDATRGPESNSSPASAPGGQQSLGPPNGPQGAPFPLPGPRFPPPPPPQRRLSPAQGSRLGLIAGVIVILGAAAGLAITLVLPTQYAARFEIQYTVSQENASEFLRTDRNLTTQTVLLTSRGVLGPVAEANGISTDDLARRVTAEPVITEPGVASEIIRVEVLDQSRETGVKLAEEISQQYLKVVYENSPKAYIQRQLDEARRQLATASPANAAALQNRINTLQGQLDTENIAGNQASIVVPAYSVPEPAYPNPIFAAATGAMTGLVVAALVVLALARRWTRS